MLTTTPICAPEAPLARANPVAKLFAVAAVSTTALIAADWLTPLLLLAALAAAGRVTELVPDTLLPAAAAFGWPVAPSTGWGF